MTFFERLAATRALRPVVRGCARSSLSVQRGTPLFEPLGVATGEILVFVLTRLALLPHASPLAVGATELAGRSGTGKCVCGRQAGRSSEGFEWCPALDAGEHVERKQFEYGPLCAE